MAIGNRIVQERPVLLRPNLQVISHKEKVCAYARVSTDNPEQEELVKSVSRFARNTVDTLTCIRELKELGVSVFFEAQNIDTMTPGGEVLLTILAAMAEQESRNMSTNIKWAYQKRFKDGEVLINCHGSIGYEKDSNGKGYVIVERKKIYMKPTGAL